jgi:hypothetical protein
MNRFIITSLITLVACIPHDGHSKPAVEAAPIEAAPAVETTAPVEENGADVDCEVTVDVVIETTEEAAATETLTTTEEAAAAATETLTTTEEAAAAATEPAKTETNDSQVDCEPAVDAGVDATKDTTTEEVAAEATEPAKTETKDSQVDCEPAVDAVVDAATETVSTVPTVEPNVNDTYTSTETEPEIAASANEPTEDDVSNDSVYGEEVAGTASEDESVSAESASDDENVPILSSSVKNGFSIAILFSLVFI